MLTYTATQPFSREELADYWYDAIHSAYEALLEAFSRAQEHGVTQQMIADRLDMDKSQVSRYLNGRRNITVRSFCNLARAMDHRLEISFRPLWELSPPNEQFGDSDTPTFNEAASDNSNLPPREEARATGSARIGKELVDA